MTAAPSPVPDIPQYQKKVLRPRRTLYCLCVPVINEGERIQKQLGELRAYAPLVDVIVADGGSNDGSLSDAVLVQNDVQALLTKTGPGRLGAQMRMALAFALESGYEGFIFMDGNGKDDPHSLPLFAAGLREGYDHIQGSRFIEGGKAINNPWWRLWALRHIHAPMVSRAARFPYTDTTNGFRAYSRNLITHSQVQPLRSIFSGYELHYYLAIRAARLGLRVKEVPVTRRYPAAGPIPTKIKPVTGSLAILSALVKNYCGAYDPPAP